MEEKCSMVILSAILYFLTYHSMLAMLLLLVSGAIGGGLLAGPGRRLRAPLEKLGQTQS
jgi:hypothetical protein